MMETIFGFLLRHSYLFLFAWVLAEQSGLPIPSSPILLAAGALAEAGRLSLAPCLILPIAATTISDLSWYSLGRWKGARVLHLICRISLEPDSCARRTEDMYARLGSKSLMFAKFVPGLNTAASPLAGVFRMPLAHFVCFDTMGAILWCFSFTFLGFVFSNQLQKVLDYALRLGEMLGLILVLALAAYILHKYVQRERFLRELRGARITPEELKRLLDSREKIQIVDLRHEIEFGMDSLTIPGALRLAPEELEARQQEILRDRDIVLYCS
jgi:membrane protein DedA with SNARE-associated domain